MTGTTRWFATGTAALALACAAALGPASGASAASREEPYGTLRVDLGQALVFSSEYVTSKPSDAPDRLVVQQTGNTFTFTNVFPIRPGKDCVAVDERQVRCTSSDPHPYLNISTGGGDDVVRSETTVGSYMYLRDGSDTVFGGTGDDKIDGGDGNDVLNGGGGDDLLEGWDGADVHIGGPGFDEVSYQFKSTAVTADLDAEIGDDGGPGEHDTIATDVEALAGSQHDDTLTGNDGNNTLRGNEGADRIYGAGGNDDLYGDWGNDVLDGHAGDDFCDVGPDNEGIEQNCERWEPNRPTEE